MSQNREIRLRILTHDLGILLRPLRHEMFYTEQVRPRYSPPGIPGLEPRPKPP